MKKLLLKNLVSSSCAANYIAWQYNINIMYCLNSLVWKNKDAEDIIVDEVKNNELLDLIPND